MRCLDATCVRMFTPREFMLIHKSSQFFSCLLVCYLLSYTKLCISHLCMERSYIIYHIHHVEFSFQFGHLCMITYDYVRLVWLCMTMYYYVWLVWLCWVCMTMYNNNNIIIFGLLIVIHDYVWLCMR